MKTKAEKIAERLEANIDLAMNEAVSALKGIDENEAADALYRRLDERMVGQILLKVRR